MGMLTQQPRAVNSQGSYLGDADKDTLTKLGGNIFQRGTDPSRAADMFLNWLTAGGAPKPLDQSIEYGKANALGPARERALSGMGMSGLFGFSKFMSSLKPSAPVLGSSGKDLFSQMMGSPKGIPSAAGVRAPPPIAKGL